jgi:hypothetical protein
MPYAVIFLEILRKTMENILRYSQYLDPEEILILSEQGLSEVQRGPGHFLVSRPLIIKN